MGLELHLKCKSELENKIRYTFETFLQSYLSGFTSQNNRDIKITYSTELKLDIESDIVIYSDEYTDEYFSKKMEFPVRRVKGFEYENNKIPFLFYSPAVNQLIRVTQDPLKVEIFGDIFASSFFFLSLWQEYVTKERDKHNRFSAAQSIQKKLNCMTFPLVNYYFGILKDVLNKYFEFDFKEVKKFNDKSFAIGLTHDIDHIKKWSLGIAYREIIKYFIFNRNKQKINERVHRLKSFIKAYSKGFDPYQISIDKILKFENDNKLSSTFFFKSGGNSKHDSKYSLKDKYLKEVFKKVKAGKKEIGLHPSYNAYKNYEMMQKEKNRLFTAITQEIDGVREHFLRYDINSTSQIQYRLNFLYDSSLGYHDYEGFRASYCLPYQIYDCVNDKKMRIWEFPLVMMDATLQEYRKFDNKASLEKIKEIVRNIKYFNGIGAFLFHNSIYDEFDYRGWGEIFEISIKYAISEDAFVGSLKEILEKAIKDKR
jgi:hypothetical protein